MAREYCVTKKTSEVGRCVGIYICKSWGIAPNTELQVKVTRIDVDKPIEYLDMRKACKTGTGLFVFFRKVWEIPKGALVRVCCTPIEKEND